MDAIVRAGADLAARGFVSTRGGNLSVRIGDRLLITRTGAALGRLSERDVVDVPLSGPWPGGPSSDLGVHLGVYARSDARAVVHAHPNAAVTLSFGCDEIVPVDHEGKVFVPRVPVVDEREDRAALGGAVGEYIAEGRRVVVSRTHGSYAAGATIEDALAWTTTLEMSAQILFGLRSR